MTDLGKTCANCGHSQATGDFCEACGARLPATTTAGTGGGAPTMGAPPPSPHSPPSTTPPFGGPSPQASPQPGAAPYFAAQEPGYQAPQEPYAPPPYGATPKTPRDDVWGGLGDFTFRRFPTPGLARLAWVVALVWIVLSLIVSLWVISDTWGGGLSVFMLLKALAVAAFAVLIVRVGLEAVLALHRIRERKEQDQ